MINESNDYFLHLTPDSFNQVPNRGKRDRELTHDIFIIERNKRNEIINIFPSSKENLNLKSVKSPTFELTLYCPINVFPRSIVELELLLILLEKEQMSELHKY